MLGAGAPDHGRGTATTASTSTTKGLQVPQLLRRAHLRRVRHDRVHKYSMYSGASGVDGAINQNESKKTCYKTAPYFTEPHHPPCVAGKTGCVRTPPANNKWTSYKALEIKFFRRTAKHTYPLLQIQYPSLSHKLGLGAASPAYARPTALGWLAWMQIDFSVSVQLQAG